MLYIPVFGCRPGPCAWYEHAGLPQPCPTYLEIKSGDINNIGISVEFGISPPSVGNPGNFTCSASGPYLRNIANYAGRIGVDVWQAWRDGRWTSSVQIRVFSGYGSSNPSNIPTTIRANPGSFTPFLPLGQTKDVTIPPNVRCGAYAHVATVTVFDDGTFTLT